MVILRSAVIANNSNNNSSLIRPAILPDHQNFDNMPALEE